MRSRTGSCSRPRCAHVRPGETVWMIGDNPDADCRPVCALGMKAVLVRGTRSGQFDCEATGLLEALDLIGLYADG